MQKRSCGLVIHRDADPVLPRWSDRETSSNVGRIINTMVNFGTDFGVGGNTESLYDGSISHGDLQHGSTYNDDVSWSTVLGWTVIMAFASGLGGLPLFFVKEIPGNINGVASALACGVMLSAAYNLIYEGERSGRAPVVVGLFTGAAFMSATKALLMTADAPLIPGDHSQKKTSRILATMMLHAVGEGSGVGSSFSTREGMRRGVLLTCAIAFHNIPEGLGVAAALVSRGMTPARACFWAIASSLPQPLTAVPIFALVSATKALQPCAVGFAAGCMLYMVFVELLPEAQRHVSPDTVAIMATVSAAVFEALRLSLDWVHDNPSTSASILEALGWSLMAGLSTGIGGLIVYVMSDISGRANAFLMGQAAGVMIVLSVLDMLLPNVDKFGWVTVFLLTLSGAVAIYALNLMVTNVESCSGTRDDVAIGEDRPTRVLIEAPPSPSREKQITNNKQRKKRLQSALLTTVALALHNAPEGLAVGITSLQSSTARKMFVAAAISLHNIPEGIAVAAAMYTATGRRAYSAWVATLTGLVEPVAAVLSVALLSPFISEDLINLSLVFVSGVMITVSVHELIPQAVEVAPLHGVLGMVFGGALVKVGLVAIGSSSP
eukprot:m.282933 g.282933  ORF g.282933 m.282933 type:complete len:607 (-) comp19868_c0_seq6:100-1920(-)